MKRNKGFSIAEAMITLTIFAVIAASAAPLVSKQIKNNTLGDIAFSALNQKLNTTNNNIIDLTSDIKDLQKSRWTIATNSASNIFRGTGNVGIGTNSPTSPLDVNGQIKVDMPESDAFNINCDNNEQTCPLRVKIGNLNRFVIRNSGGLYLKPKENSTKLLIQDDNGEDQLVYQANKFWGMNRRTIGTGTAAERTVYRFQVAGNGSMFLYPPTRAEIITTPDTIVRNDATAFSIRWPEDGPAESDCGTTGDTGATCTPTIDGYTQTAFFTSNGSLYINSINVNRTAFQIRNGNQPRSTFFSNGTLQLRPIKHINENGIANNRAISIGPAISERANASTDEETVYIKTDGDAKFDGDVVIGTSLRVANRDITASIDSINSELIESKKLIAELQTTTKEANELIVELKKQNELLTQKVALLEENQNKPLINELNKLAKNNKDTNIFSRIANLTK